MSLPFSVKFALRLASTCFICCRICLCPAVPSTRKDSSPMPTVIVPHPVKHGKRVVVYLPDESDSWTAAELRAAIDTSLFFKYGTSAPAIDTAHMDGRLESCNVEVSTENKEVPDLQQTTQQQQTNADAGDARPRKFRRLDLTSMPAGEVIDLD